MRSGTAHIISDLAEEPPRWPLKPLRDVLRHRSESVQIDDFATYKRCRVQLHAQGVVLRDEVPGVDVKTKRQQVCRAGDFLVAEIDAKVGGYGIVPPELEGAVVSSHYFLFEVDPRVLDERYLDRFVRTTAFADQVQAKGSTNYAAIRPSHVLGYGLPLPPLSEQRKIVSRIESQLGKVARLREAMQARNSDLERLAVALAHRNDLSEVEKVTQGWRRVRLGDVMHPDSDPVVVQADESYPNLGVLSFARGLFAKPPISGLDSSASTLYRVRRGQVIYSRLFAFEGAYAYVAPEFDGLYVSNEFPTFTTSPEVMLAEFFFAYMKHPSVWETMKVGSKGLGNRRQRVQPETILAHGLWIPPMPEQVRIVSALNAHHAVAGDRTQEERLVALERSILNAELGLGA